MTDHAKEIEEIANKFHTYELDRGQYTLHPMTLDGQKLAAAAAEIRRLHAENALLKQAISTATTKLETQRIWGGMEWHYNPLPPLYYKPVLEGLNEALRETMGK